MWWNRKQGFLIWKEIVNYSFKYKDMKSVLLVYFTVYFEKYDTSWTKPANENALFVYLHVHA